MPPTVMQITGGMVFKRRIPALGPGPKAPNPMKNLDLSEEKIVFSRDEAGYTRG